MSRSKKWWLFIGILGLIALLAACSVVTPEAPAAGSVVGGTNLAVAPEFETYYAQNGGAPVFGFPIKNPFVDPESGRLVQYFQHLHLEFDQASQTITPSPLGELFVPPESEQILVPSPESGFQRTFTETGFAVRDEFLVFYEGHGDEAVFGPPITAQLDEGGRLVQYFENAQLVWNPNALPEFRVEIADLGSTYLWKFGSPVADEIFNINSSATVLEADVSSSVKKPILYAGEEQVLFVSVKEVDSLLMVEGADVSVTIRYAGMTTEMVLPPTDEFGRTQGVLELTAVEPGQKVQVEVEAISVAEFSIGQTTLSFKTWW